MTWEEKNGWLVFSAKMIDPQKARGEGEYAYGSSIRVDNENYVLEDLAEYNKDLEPIDINIRRKKPFIKYNQWNFLQRKLEGKRRRINNGYLEIEHKYNQGRDTRWEKPQFLIYTSRSEHLYVLSSQLDDSIRPLIQEKIKKYNNQTDNPIKVGELSDYDDINDNRLIFDFSGGGGEIEIEMGSQHRARRFFLPREIEKKNDCWIAIKKEAFLKHDESERLRIHDVETTNYFQIWQKERIVSANRDELLKRIGKNSQFLDKKFLWLILFLLIFYIGWKSKTKSKHRVCSHSGKKIPV